VKIPNPGFTTSISSKSVYLRNLIGENVIIRKLTALQIQPVPPSCLLFILPERNANTGDHIVSSSFISIIFFSVF
jgi:hypothetical protein